ncbi:Uncharacterised protein [uncultured archaeon]|nr:Uncharacterised protein [uncultured archaeon]
MRKKTRHRKGSANDGIEVELIQFFKKFPEGATMLEAFLARNFEGAFDFGGFDFDVYFKQKG